MINPQVQRINEMIAQQEAAEKAALEASTQQIPEVVPVQPPTETVESPVVPEIETPVEEVKDIAYYQRLAEEKSKESDNWQKRRKDAEKELLPALEDRALLKRQLEEAKEKLAEIDALKQELASVKQALTSKPATFDLPSDFNETYPDIAQALASTVQSVKSDADRRIEMLEAEFKSSRKAREEAEQQALMAQHFNAVKSVHSDLEDFVGDKYGPALRAWAESQPPIFGRIVSNPVDFDPKDVAAVISQFKKETGYMAKPVAKAPAAGDIGFKAGVTQSPKIEQGITLLSDEEMRRLPELMHQVRFNPEARQKLLDRLGATERKMFNR